jgi:hypothetical protein
MTIKEYVLKHHRIRPDVASYMTTMFTRYNKRLNVASVLVDISHPWWKNVSNVPFWVPGPKLLVSNTYEWPLWSGAHFAIVCHELYHVYEFRRKGTLGYYGMAARGVVKSVWQTLREMLGAKPKWGPHDRHSTPFYRHSQMGFEKRAMAFEKWVNKNVDRTRLESFK